MKKIDVIIDAKAESSKTLPDKTSIAVEKKKDPSKCFLCNKKTGMYGFKCKCGGNFCKNHRLPEEHQCTFDFAAEGKKRLSDSNPVVYKGQLEQI